MDRTRGPQRYEISGILIRLRAVVAEIDLHLRDEVVFFLRRRREGEPLPNIQAFRRFAFQRHATVRLFLDGEFSQSWRFGALDNRPDWEVVGTVQDHAVTVLANRVIEQNRFSDRAATVRQVKFYISVPERL
jgi:hypothetical protein